MQIKDFKKISLIAIIWVLLEFVAAFFTAIAVIFASFCSKFGDYHTTDYKEYGDWYNYKIPAFLPESLDGYLNETSSNCVYEYRVAFLFDVVSEIFLDVKLDEEMFNEKIIEFKSMDGVLYEQPAYYDENFVEIVFEDNYYQSSSKENYVGWANIEKIIYNVSACEIIFVVFHANDSDVYKLDEVAYFNRFNIDEKEYIANYISKE